MCQLWLLAEGYFVQIHSSKTDSNGISVATLAKEYSIQTLLILFPPKFSVKKFNFGGESGSSLDHAPKDDIHQRLLCDIYYVYNIIKRASDRGPLWRRLYNRSYILLYSDGSEIIALAKNCHGLILPDPDRSEHQKVAQAQKWEIKVGRRRPVADAFLGVDNSKADI